MPEFDKFIYKVLPRELEGRTYGLQVKISYYDPERWDGKGGELFAFGTEVVVDDESWLETLGADAKFEIEVRQSGNSLVSIEHAEMRANINRQALEMAYFIQDQLAAGEDLGTIAQFLSKALKAGEPVEKGFRYSVTNRELVGK